MFTVINLIKIALLFAAFGTIAQGAEPVVPERPQEPTSLVPYRVQEITFESAGEIQLAGTMTRPDEVGPFPGIVLVAGAGGQFQTDKAVPDYVVDSATP
jgi:hypothetical protein